ncbi:NUDIX domain-containing protein [Treponema phagedenis]|uniref:8-oxo-dGTP diphosphatase n=1 Tax=Treponema phagedenis TaxID=162 RepID=A0A0B7GYF1_TREPH|nr:NUDIX domain-containing protein [Treponema phagedenis]EFW39141.1 mutator mutT protein [Treponema phagedenis F0421]NVP23166.1 NUDIX domain-containing protein [Treponema phagedenis]QEJ94843.1 NUDIX domain-containing protein [Treponema phagedenis]QEJ98026.1 NUDIX domain-containing protein [Treponema phagedenis]QEK00744.1 NUDIX domain-containing protein [Treponema phagedenis]
MKQSVVGIVFLDNKFLLGLRKNEGKIGGFWEFPGGKCEGNETHTQALQREYLEELEIAIEVGKFIGKNTFDNGRYLFELFAYEVFLPENAKLECNEHQRFSWFSFSDLQTLHLVPSDKLFLSQLREFYNLK